jgi:hypothetical protein
MSFFRDPDISVVQALLLNFKPVNLDVLPIYILFLLSEGGLMSAQGQTRSSGRHRGMSA